MLDVERTAVIGELIMGFEPVLLTSDESVYLNTNITINSIDSPDKDESLFTLSQEETERFVEYLELMTNILKDSLKVRDTKHGFKNVDNIVKNMKEIPRV